MKVWSWVSNHIGPILLALIALSLLVVAAIADLSRTADTLATVSEHLPANELSLGGGFYTDLDMPDAHYINCRTSDVQLMGAGGIVRALQETFGQVNDGGTTAIVIARFPPIVTCNLSEFVITTMEATDVVYLASRDDYQVSYGAEPE